MKVGVLALQGGVEGHARALDAAGAQALEVRVPADLDSVEALVLPGGESTTISLLLGSSGLRPVLAERLAGGLPVLATCAGLILLAGQVVDGHPDQRGLGVMDVVVRRNGFGRQSESFEAALPVEVLGGRPFDAVFIRAPVVESVGPGVTVLARWAGQPVLCRQGRMLAASFHPEVSGDARLHRYFVTQLVKEEAA